MNKIKKNSSNHKEPSMISKPFSNSFARAYLQHNNIELYYGGTKKRILPPINNSCIMEKFSKYLEEDFRPKFKIKGIKRPQPIIVIEKITQLLNDFGLVIKSRKPDGTDATQSNSFRIEYYLAKPKLNDVNYRKQMPRGHNVIFDSIEKIFKINGPKASSDVYEYNKEVVYEAKKEDKFGREYSLDWKDIPSLVNRNIEKFRVLERGDMPIGINYEALELICIPTTYDSPIIALFGRRGQGKSMLLNAINGYRYCLGDKCLSLSDIDDEQTTWARRNLACKYKDNPRVGYKLRHQREMLDSINMSPRPLPIAFIIPHSSKKDKEKFYHKEEEIELFKTLNWKKIIQNYSNLTKNYPIMDLGASGQYINLNELAEVKSVKEFEDYIDSKIPKLNENGKLIKGNEKMRNRIFSRLGKFFDEELTDVSTGIPSTIDIIERGHKKTMPMLVGLMHIGIIPIIRTRTLSSITIGKENILPICIDFEIKEIFNEKIYNENFKNNNVFIIIDELSTLLSKGNVTDSIMDIVKLGRHHNIGLAIAQHNYSENSIMKDIKNNIDYLICFKHSIKSEINAICKDWGGDKEIADDIQTLSKQWIDRNAILFEAYLFPRKPYVIYDLITGKRTENNTDIKKMTTFPPLNMHKRPDSIKKQMEENK